MKLIRFTRESRKHKIGKAHAFHVMTTVDADIDGNRLVWLGPDDRGVELEIVMVETADVFLVIHVKPTYPKGK